MTDLTRATVEEWLRLAEAGSSRPGLFTSRLVRRIAVEQFPALCRALLDAMDREEELQRLLEQHPSVDLAVKRERYEAEAMAARIYLSELNPFTEMGAWYTEPVKKASTAYAAARAANEKAEGRK